MVAWRQGPVEFPGGSPIQLAKDDSLCEWDDWDEKLWECEGR